MLLRISLIIAILAGIGTIVVTQKVARDHIDTVITERNDHMKKEDEERKGRKKAETTLAATSNVLNQTKATLAKTEEELNNTKQQLAASQANLQKVQGELAAAVETRKAAEQQLAKWTQVGLTPEQTVALQKSYRTAQDTVAVLEDEKKILSRNVQEWKSKYLAMIGGDSYEAPLPAGTKGSIVAVDPKWNFVVLDIGKNKGLLERGVLLVHRDSKYLGKVRISEVQENRAIANVIPGTALGEIQEGDQVLY